MNCPSAISTSVPPHCADRIQTLLADPRRDRLTSLGNYWFYAVLIPVAYLALAGTVFYYFPVTQQPGVVFVPVSSLLALLAIFTNGKMKRVILRSDGVFVIQGIGGKVEIPCGHLDAVEGHWSRAGYILKLSFSPATPFGRWIETTPPEKDAVNVLEFLNRLIVLKR